MALAYHILAHKNPRQVFRLLQCLDHHDDLFIVHFDRRAPPELHAIGQAWASRRKNVIVQVSRNVEWGGPKISDLQIEAMGLALQHGRPWHHFINLTGQDFPLSPRPHRVRLLGEDPARSYLSWFEPLLTNHWANARERVEHWHFHSPALARLLKVPGLGRRIRAACGWSNRIPYLPGHRRRWDFRYFGGSNYVVLAREACQYIFSDARATRLRQWLSHAAHPDEIVYQSILHNSPLAPTLVNRDWREIDFPPHAPHPRIFQEADFPRLTASKNLFARKFDETVDDKILSLLAHHLTVA